MEVVALLHAKLKNGDSIALYQYSREEIEALRANETFYCPICKDKVIIKAGTKTIAHFAHQRAAICLSQERGEGEYHEKGKLLMYKWLVLQGIEAELEVYFPSIKQRADILVKIGSKRIAIEYQCARIPIQDVFNRTMGYLQEGIQPIWIIGGNHFTRTGNKQLKANPFLLQFFHRFTSNRFPVLYFFDPHTSFFIKAANLFPVNQYQVYSDLSIKKLGEMHFLELFTQTNFSEAGLIKTFTKAKYKFRMYHPPKTFGRERKWNNWLYSYGTHREFLPSIVFLPVASQYRMNIPLWDWQSRICLEIIAPTKIGDTFSLNDCIFLLQNYISPNSPLINGVEDPLLEYLQLLSSLNIISISSKYIFQKCQEIHFYSHVEEALAGDQKLMGEISEIFKSKYEHD